MQTLFIEKTSSKGIAIAKAYVINRQDLNADQHHVPPGQVDYEIRRFDDALEEAKAQLETLASGSDLFKAHLGLISDASLYDGVIRRIRQEYQNAQMALENTIAEYSAVFQNMNDSYIKERVDDLYDIRTRILRILKGVSHNLFDHIKEQVIIVADNLVLSDTSYLNLDYIMGFVTEHGGVTSHVSIIARNLELPALVGVKDLMKLVHHDDLLILDASAGLLIINPDNQTIDKYTKLKEIYVQKCNELKELSTLPAATTDGKTVKICANIGNLEDVKKAVRYHIDGIGLFRSEFLYMNNTHFPTEEEQYAVYKEAAVLCDKELVIRTLDIGGDKSLPYFSIEKEENPYLGWRAIRISLELREVFKTQLRAILRASAYGNVKLMYPMIISLEELKEANMILEECKKELTRLGIPYQSDIKVGIMIETPAAVLCADSLAKYVDFFSIGTNDLTQYLLAVDRSNNKISKLFDSFHPAVIKSIKQVIDAAHANGIEVGMCGELASDEKATLLLLGLGLDEFSMSAGDSAGIKNIIRHTSYEEAKRCAEHVMSLTTKEEVKEYLSMNK